MAKDYAERMVKGSLIVFILAAVGTLIGYALRVFLSRSLTIEDFGLFYAILVFMGLLNIFKDSGLSTTLSKMIPEFLVKNMKKEMKFSFIFVLIVQLIIGAAAALVVLSLSSQIAIEYFQTAESLSPLIVIVMSFFVSIFMVIFQAAFRGFGSMKYYSLVDPLRIIITFVSVLFLIPLGVLGAAYSYLIASILVSAFSFAVLYSRFKIFSVKLEKKFTAFRGLARRLVIFSVPIFVGSIGGIVLFNIDTVMLTLFRSLEEVGIYQVAMPTSQLLWVFIASLSPIILPLFSEMWARKEKHIIANSLSLLIKFSFIFILPIVLILVAFPDLIIRVLFSESYIAAVPALQILAVSAIFYSLTMLLVTVLIAIGKPYLQTKIIFIMAISSFVLNFSLVPFFGVIGSSFAFTFSTFAGLIFSIYFLKKNISINVPWLQVIKSFIGGFLTLLIIFALKGILVMHAYAETVIALIIGFGFYFLFIIYTRAITKNDLTFLEKINIRIPDTVIKIIMRLVKE